MGHPARLELSPCAYGVRLTMQRAARRRAAAGHQRAERALGQHPGGAGRPAGHAARQPLPRVPRAQAVPAAVLLRQRAGPAGPLAPCPPAPPPHARARLARRRMRWRQALYAGRGVRSARSVMRLVQGTALLRAVCVMEHPCQVVKGQQTVGR
jgi:hypothetical protein